MANPHRKITIQLENSRLVLLLLLQVHSFSSDRHMLKKARKVILGKEKLQVPLTQLVNRALQVKTKIIKLVQVLLLLHKQVKMELKQTLPTTKVKALQKLQELKLIKPMLHKQTLVQILPDKITKLLVLHKELKLLAQVKLRQLQLLEILKLNLMLKQQIKVMELL